jgi:hypothetical protein
VAGAVPNLQCFFAEASSLSQAIRSSHSVMVFLNECEGVCVALFRLPRDGRAGVSCNLDGRMITRNPNVLAA